MSDDLQPPEGEGYDLQRVYAEKAKPFWFRWEDQWWKLPHLTMLDFEIQAQVAEFDFAELAADDMDIEESKKKLNELFDLLMGAEQGKQWRDVSRPLPVLLDMIHQWTAHSGGSSGESSASSGSSESTERPSKRTSTASTGSGSRKRSTAKKTAPRKAATPRANS